MTQLTKQIMEKRPVIHYIANLVSANDCANVILAAGGSPSMAHVTEEVEEVTSGCDGLVLNLGATECYDAMLLAGRRAKELGHKIVLDPVGVGSSSYRREFALHLIQDVRPDCIRGNYSEIQALYYNKNTTVGVDADKDAARENMDRIVSNLALESQTIIVASGVVDVLSDGIRIEKLVGGSPMMKSITGSGCMSSALLGVFLSVAEEPFDAVRECVKFINDCAKNAEIAQKKERGGNMTYKYALIDGIYHAIREDLA